MSGYNCNVTWWALNGDIPRPLMNFYIFYCIFICIFGTICNLVALWCVVSCSRTYTPVKVLLCALFSTTLLMCLFVMPFMVHVSLGKMWCDRDISEPVLRVVIHIYIVLTQIELFYIFVMALLRALAVWAPQRGHVRMTTAVIVAVGVALYNCSIIAMVAEAFYKEVFSWPTLDIILKAYYAVHFFLPVLLTLGCYLSTIVAVRRNKRKLAASKHSGAVTQVVDEATRAMLAVFISNLLLGLPHSIYHNLPIHYTVLSYVIMHSVFFTHLFADPLVFLYFNQHHRRRIAEALKSCIGTSPRKGESSVTSQATKSSSIASKNPEQELSKGSLAQELCNA